MQYDGAHLPMKKLVRGLWRVLPEPLKKKVRSAYKAVVPNETQLQLLPFGEFELAVRNGTVDARVARETFVSDIYLPNLPEYQPGEDHVIIDVGAHIGPFALKASRVASRGRVYAVEACRETYCLLRINKALNGADNIVDVYAALAGESGQATLYHSRENWGHSTVAERGTAHTETVRALSLRDFLEQYGIEHCDFIKFNCEGGEFPILLGSSPETLRRFDVMLVLYHGDLYPGAETEEDLAAHLRAAGFKTQFRHQEGQRGWIVATRR
jgi:FkbM family methyltransferase